MVLTMAIKVKQRGVQAFRRAKLISAGLAVVCATLALLASFNLFGQPSDVRALLPIGAIAIVLFAFSLVLGRFLDVR